MRRWNEVMENGDGDGDDDDDDKEARYRLCP